MAKGVYISDSIHGLTQLSEYEKKIIASVGFNRLHDVYQNSTVYLTYPSNRTKRFEHSIGTMNLCSKMFYNSVTNMAEGKLDSFYQIYEKELNAIIESIKNKNEYKVIFRNLPKAIPDLKWDNFQMSLIPKRVPDQYTKIHMILIQAIRAAALLHDIGHPPYSHVVERAMKSAYEKCRKKKDEEIGSATEEYIRKMEPYKDKTNPLHEAMGVGISYSILMGILMQSKAADQDMNYLTYESLILESVLKIFNDEGNFSYLHKIIDNSLDGDRLDYVTRDPANSGMNVGSIDYNRIIMDMRIIMKGDNDDIAFPFFAIPLKAVNAVEDFLKRRYDLYKNIIFHHRVIKTDYLMEYMVAELIDRHLKEADKLPKDKTETSEMTDAIPFDISGLWAPLGQQALAERDCILSQWNDSWLITVLKKIYYEQYHNISNMSDSGYVVSKQFSELLNNERSYTTIIKRHEDFKFIDNAVKKVFFENADDLQEKINSMNRESEDDSKGEEEKQENGMLNITKYLREIETILKYVQLDGSNDNEFILSRLWYRKKLFSLENLTNDVKEITERACKDILQSCKVLNSIVVFKEISLGIETKTDEFKKEEAKRDEPQKGTIYFFDNDEHLYSLDEVSGIANTLRMENLSRPVFYLYLLFNDNNKKLTSEEKEKLLTKIGSDVGKLIIDTINQNIDGFIKQNSKWEEMKHVSSSN